MIQNKTDGDQLVSNLVKDPEVKFWLMCEALTRAYGWTINEILEQPLRGINAYMTINKGRQKKNG